MTTSLSVARHYFVELHQILGAKSTVPNLDIFGNSVLALTAAICMVPEKWVHSMLDDVVREMMCRTYRQICKEINIGLALDCELYTRYRVQ